MSAWDMRETELYAEVLAMCEDRNLWPTVLKPERYNQRTASNKGFPDLVIFGAGGVLYRELKTMAGVGVGRGLRSDQVTWRDRLLASGQDWGVWTPKDLESGLIESQLAALEKPRPGSDAWALVQLGIAPVTPAVGITRDQDSTVTAVSGSPALADLGALAAFLIKHFISRA